MLSRVRGEDSCHRCSFHYSLSAQVGPGVECSLLLSADYSLSILGLETQRSGMGVACGRDRVRESGCDKEVKIWCMDLGSHPECLGR